LSRLLYPYGERRTPAGRVCRWTVGSAPTAASGRPAATGHRFGGLFCAPVDRTRLDAGKAEEPETSAQEIIAAAEAQARRAKSQP